MASFNPIYDNTPTKILKVNDLKTKIKQVT